jgi:hypothetical protein
MDGGVIQDIRSDEDDIVYIKDYDTEGRDLCNLVGLDSDGEFFLSRQDIKGELYKTPKEMQAFRDMTKTLERTMDYLESIEANKRSFAADTILKIRGAILDAAPLDSYGIIEKILDKTITDLKK